MKDFTALFVDDEADSVRSMVRRMERRNIRAIGVGSGEEAIAILGKGDPPVDVVVLDDRMPGMGGIETLKTIRERNPMIEVIMLSGRARMDVAKAGMALGAFDYLMKPVDIDELMYKLQDAFSKKTIQEKKKRGKQSRHSQGGDPTS